ncbi:hypothetical protein [Streptomyces griseosporeus]|uniref:hypothetical protein n=1 Tax=Streptomyces griseosporeus TaxID=1910 RepID=UPI00379E99E5
MGGTRAALWAVAAAGALCLGPAAGAAGAADAREPGGQAVLPDVALVTAGGTGRTTAVRAGDPGFAGLRQLLQPSYTGTERVPEAWSDGGHPPVRVVVLWGRTGVGGWPQTDRPPGGDVAMERQDELFLAGDGTPWVRSDPSPEVEDDDIRWHRASRRAYDAVQASGLLGPAPVKPHGRPAMHGAWWALPGLAVGLAVGAGGTALVRRASTARPREDGPRHQLIDL